MCTAIVRKTGRDVICGFNFDITPDVPFRAVMDDRAFYLGTDVSGICRAAAEKGRIPEAFTAYPDAAEAYLAGIENGIRKIEGVSRDGHFGVQLGNQDSRKAPFSLAPGCLPIDAMIDDYLSGRTDWDESLVRASLREITNQPVFPGITPEFPMHAMMADRNGRVLIVEPGTGWAVIREKYAVMTNFELLEVPADMRDERFGYFGRDRYDRAAAALRESNESFSPEDALRILESVKTAGNFATRFSFVYSNRENRVYYVENGDFARVKSHAF